MAASGSRLEREDSPPRESLILAIAKSSGQFGVGTGIAGVAIGGTVGLFRSNRPGIFAVASGIQCFSLGFCFSASRTGALLGLSFYQRTPVDNLTANEKRIASAFGGASAGAIMTSAFRGGKAHIVPGMLVWSVVGLSGQFVVDALWSVLRKQRQGPSNQSLFDRIMSSKWSPMKKLTDEEYENMLQERLVRIEAEIALLDDDLNKLKSKNDNKDEEGKA